jgi:hypothetical protein
MTEEENKEIQKLKENIKVLITMFENSKNSNQKLIEENQELLKKQHNIDKDLKDLQIKYDTLKVAKAFTGNTEEASEAKLKVNKIVREIDKCIALLNR